MAFIMMLGGVSYAYFIYNDDVVDVSLETGGMQVTYTSGNTLDLTGAIPMNDNLGKISPHYIDFSVTGRTDTEDIYYEIILVPKDGNTINPRYVKTYLTDQSNNNLHGVCPYDLMQNSSYKSGKVIYSNVLLHNTDGSVKNTTTNFRLRVWLDETYNDQTSKTFAFDAYVYAQNVNVNLMNTFPSAITDVKANIKEIYFQSDTRENIDRDYAAATIKADVTYQSRGNVKAWLVPDTADNTMYIMYVKSDGEIYLSTGDSLFNNYTSVTKIILTNINTTLITSMNNMFGYDSSLSELNTSKFNTINVTTFGSAFRNCSSLTSINLSNYDMSNNTSLNLTFYSCSGLEGLNALDVSKMNTSSVTTFSGTFQNCSKITVLDVSRFNTMSATTMEAMFSSCSKVATFNVSSFDTSNVVSMKNMFYNCGEIVTLDLSNFDTSKVTTMMQMFFQCKKLSSLNVYYFNTINLRNMQSMFYYCSALTVLDLSSFDTRNVTNMGGTFQRSGFVTIYVSDRWINASVTTTNNTFASTNNIVGGQGTTKEGNPDTAVYARIDDPDNDLPGYLTYKPYPA